MNKYNLTKIINPVGIEGYRIILVIQYMIIKIILSR